MAIAETEPDVLHDDHHDHGEFIAHHFESAEQQFDSGKLGIWLFLVTEVLFFSGLFVAYTLYRSNHPEIFEQAHIFLDKYLGALNTVVLLFSSLTMACGVRCAQLGKNRGVAFFTLITMICAAMFLGVKAIEYSHKWDMGIFPRSMFAFSEVHPEQMGIAKELDISNYLVYLSVIPAILLVVFPILSAIMAMTQKSVLAKFFGCLAITTGGYFLGAVGAQVYMVATDGGIGGSHASSAPMVMYAQEHAGTSGTSDQADKTAAAGHADSDASHEQGQTVSHGPDPSKFNRDIGIFFSIYYCMTGLHAIHILGGIAFLSWILYRSLLGHWRPDYFGPVDSVGLYWHLVDLIWIYLFPLLYLID